VTAEEGTPAGEWQVLLVGEAGAAVASGPARAERTPEGTLVRITGSEVALRL
jgi:hypothetical protein